MRIVMGLLIVLLMNGLFFLADMAINDLSIEGGAPDFYNTEGSLLESYDTGNYTAPSSVTLPETAGGVTSDTGSTFTDIFRSIKESIFNIPLIGDLLKVVTAFSSFIALTGLPSAAQFVINAIWYGFNFFLLISFMWGRD